MARMIAIPCSLLLLAMPPLRAGEPERIGALREELRVITAALHAERGLAELLTANDLAGIAATGERIATLERMRELALLRLVGRAERPQGRRPSSAVPPAAFTALLTRPEWAAADPPFDAAGLWEAVHVKTGLVFVLIPGGRYTMGWEEHVEEERRPGLPPRAVVIDPFLLCKTECTQEAWRRGGSTVRIEVDPGDALPITDVSWTTCRAWCLQNGLRLATEEEWEYACRAGTRTLWPHGDEEGLLDAYAWFVENGGQRMHPVAGLLPNDWGLYDMTGNVSEFIGRMEDKVGLVYRGGSYKATARGCRSSYRYIGYSGGYVVRHKPDIGFRPAANLAHAD